MAAHTLLSDSVRKLRRTPLPLYTTAVPTAAGEENFEATLMMARYGTADLAHITRVSRALRTHKIRSRG